MKIIKELLPYIIVVLVVILIRTFIVTPIQVEGISMKPTLDDNQILLLKKYDKTYRRFDIVVVKLPSERLIKRVIGLPGDTVRFKDNQLYINGKYVKEPFQHAKTEDFEYEQDGEKKIPAGYYFVMGDNRDHSMDSRMIGPVSKDKIVGKTNFSLFPFQKFGSIE